MRSGNFGLECDQNAGSMESLFLVGSSYRMSLDLCLVVYSEVRSGSGRIFVSLAFAKVYTSEEFAPF